MHVGSRLQPISAARSGSITLESSGGRNWLPFPAGIAYSRPMLSLTNAQLRDLKAQAQRLKATLKIGKEGLSPNFLAALDEVLKHRELVKVKFDEFKEQKKELAPQLAEKSHSHLVTRVGNVVVLYRPKPIDEKQPE